MGNARSKIDEITLRKIEEWKVGKRGHPDFEAYQDIRVEAIIEYLDGLNEIVINLEQVSAGI